MTSYLDTLRAAARQRNRDAAIRLISQKAAGHELGTPEFLSGKSDDYIFARLDAITRGVEETDARSDGRQTREDNGAPSGPYAMGGYNRFHGDSHRDDAAEAAYQRSKAALNAGRHDREGVGTITAAEKERMGREQRTPDTPADPVADRVAALKATKQEASLLRQETRANEELAEAEDRAWEQANARLNANRKPKQE